VNPQISVIVHNNPTITIPNTNQTQTNVENYTAGVVPPAPPAVALPAPVPVPARPVCRPGLIGNLGGDPAGLGSVVHGSVGWC